MDVEEAFILMQRETFIQMNGIFLLPMPSKTHSLIKYIISDMDIPVIGFTEKLVHWIGWIWAMVF